MRPITSSPYAAVFLGVVLLLGAYAGAYYAMVKKGTGIPMLTGRRVIWPPAVSYYGYGEHDKMLNRIFTPVHAIDRKVRKEFWGPKTKDVTFSPW